MFQHPQSRVGIGLAAAVDCVATRIAAAAAMMQMSDVVEPMTDEEVADLAHVLARLK